MVMVRVRTPEEQILDGLRSLIGANNKAAGYRGGLGVGYKHDATGTPTQYYGHGPGGVFSYPGVSPDVFSTVIGVEAGLIGALPKFPTQYTNPLFMTITSIGADTGDEPDAYCDPSPVAGLTQACIQTSLFGSYKRQTREIYLNRFGQYRDPADPMNLQLMNMMPGIVGGDPIMNPQIAAGGMGNPLELEYAKLLLEFGTSVNRLLDRQLFIGNPVNNSAGGGYAEMVGLDIQVGTGKVDAVQGTACPAMDSDVKDFNYQNVRDFSTYDIVQTLTYMYRYVRTIARRAGLLPAEWAFVMREEAFYEITSVWPISYVTSAGTMGQVRDQDWQRGNINLTDAAAQRDEMRREYYLLIDGMRIPVILDDGIPEQTNTTDGNVPNASFASDIYLLPLTVMGGTPVLYLQYFQHNNASLLQALGDGRLANQVWTTNDGAWIWTNERTRLCVFWEGKVEPRLILRTPQLAGRLQNVVYSPLQHTREPFPDEPYFVGGGVSQQPGPSYYQDWNQ